jgi:peptidoglycan/LPS O-acetylase OafA/YrhL
MNLEELRNNILAAARANRPSERVPYGFEHRIMARLTLRPALDQWAFWARALWRAAAPCVAMMLLIVFWVLFRPAPGSNATDLSLDLENTLLTVAEQEPPPTDFFW